LAEIRIGGIWKAILSSRGVEIVTPASAQPNGRHADLPVGAIAIYAWAGQPDDPTNQVGGVHWIQAADWLPYQKKTFVTPAFPGYISGHSTFSRAAAEVLAAITGSPFFPGGIGTYMIKTLAFEKGPTQPVELHWGTYFEIPHLNGCGMRFKAASLGA
jgi:hypothetical protein